MRLTIDEDLEGAFCLRYKDHRIYCFGVEATAERVRQLLSARSPVERLQSAIERLARSPLGANVPSMDKEIVIEELKQLLKEIGQ
jgi:hypothetical protein